jgi:nucleotide-binding universal stress UspA family protein
MRFIVAWDGSDGAQAALRQAKALAGSDGQVDLVHVLNPLIDASDVQAPSTREAMVIVKQRAEAAMAASAGGANQHVIVLERGEDVPERLLAEAARLKGDVVVIASRRATGILGSLGSIAQEVLQDSLMPVLVVRA